MDCTSTGGSIYDDTVLQRQDACGDIDKMTDRGERWTTGDKVMAAVLDNLQNQLDAERCENDYLRDENKKLQEEIKRLKGEQ